MKLSYPQASKRLVAVLAQLTEWGLLNEGAVFTTEFLRKEMNKRGWWLVFTGALIRDGFKGELDNKILDTVLGELVYPSEQTDA